MKGEIIGPSQWQFSEDTFIQNSNIFDGVFGAAALEKKGTYAYPVYGDFGWTDYILTTSLESKDNDVIGIMFRFTDSSNYYRFSMSSQYGFPPVNQDCSRNDLFI